MGRRAEAGRGIDYDAVVLDSHGLSKAADGDRRIALMLAASIAARIPVIVSAITLVEVLRGHRRDAAVHLLLKGCRVEPVSAEVGRAAGELLGHTGRKDTVDAVVAVTAARLPGSVRLLTSDPSDLGALTDDLAKVHVEAV